MSERPAPRERLEQRDFLIQNRKLDIWHHAISQLKWVFLTIIVWFAYLAIDSIAGKSTILDIGIKAIASVVSGKLESFLVGALIIALMGWWFERSLRRRTIEQFHEIREKYENLIDSNRSSSRLTPQGRSRPED
ncbi:MAG: hypothetical protein OXG62_03480 [Nitrospinae bacterium]|nr:hypothetical protein [Nitrospinota bacterium]